MNNGNTTPISSDGRIAGGGVNFVGPSDKPTFAHVVPDLAEEVEEDSGEPESGA